MSDQERPKCGCVGAYYEYYDDSCLYPEAVAHTAELEGKLAHTLALLAACIREASWQGSGAIKAAADWMEESK